MSKITDFSISDAAITLIKVNRFYSCILAKMVKEEAPNYGTIGVGFTTNGKLSLIYDPEWLLSKPIEEVQALLIHETLHVFWKHLNRLKNESENNRKLVNIAMDIAINQYIDNLPNDAFYPNTYDFKKDLSAEEYYDLLKKNQENKSNKNSKKEKENKENNGGDDSSDDKGNDGSVDDHGLWDKVIDNGVIKDIKDFPDIDVDQEVESIVKKSIEECKNYGTLPNFIKKEIDRIKNNEHKHNWKREFRVFVNSVLSRSTRYSLKKPSKRLYPLGIYVPGKRKSRKPRLLLCRDTSGSCMDPKLQQLFQNEMIEISKRADLTVCDFDTKIKQEYKVKKNSDFREYIGGGGTCFLDCFNHAKKGGYDAIILLTDTYGQFPEKSDIGKLATHCIWAVFNMDNVSTPFGKVVNIK